MSSTKRGHFISQVHNKGVKWSVKPCIVITKKVKMKNSNVRESTIACDTLLIIDVEYGVK